ncbi:MAG: hypothetical protein M1450_03890 [Patescibacteria group bacterium]|nr:hypothetical protein [Patescibacteria group bacterium]
MTVELIYDEGKTKEDSFLINPWRGIFGVFDGTSSLRTYFQEKNIMGPGRIASDTARDIFSKNEGTLKKLALKTNEEIRKKILKEEIKEKNACETTAAVVKINNNNFEWLQVLDSIILIIYKDNSFKLLVEDYDIDKKALLKWKVFAVQKKQNIRKLIEPENQEARENANRTYGILNGDPRFTKFLKTGIENLDRVKHIILFTDGLLLPKKDPSKPDDLNSFVELFLGGGLVKIRDYVRNLQKDDPNCWIYPRFKQYDDITAISISF